MDSDEVAELFAEAVATSRVATGPDGYDAVWDVLERVVDAHPIAVVLALARLNDGDAVVRATACDLLGLLSGRRDDLCGDAATALIALAATEVDDDVRWSIARALGATRDARAVATLVDLAGHVDPDVRFQVAVGLFSVLAESSNDAGVAALIALCGDDDPEVRNWATFGLGWICVVDGDDVRRALWQRTTDSFAEAREEGIRGLARRRVQQVLPLLSDLLAEDSVHVFTLDAAGLLGHPALVPLLERFGPDDRQAVDALRECDPVRRAHRDSAAMDLFDAVQAQRPDLDIAIFGERCEVGLWLALFNGAPAADSRRWRAEDLLARADGDPQLAARLILADLAEPRPPAAG